MVGASKILTVSYGTFSCTLEGFDEPFNTMKAIAEYFRDLAAEDRYFGAEPPTPDAAMLHQIAEREMKRRVEAKVQDNGVILRATDSLNAPAPQMPAPLAAGPTTPDTMFEDQHAAPTPASPAPQTAEAGISESVAAKLSRIRNAMAETRASGETTRPPVSLAAALAAAEAEEEAKAAAEAEAEAEATAKAEAEAQAKAEAEAEAEAEAQAKAEAEAAAAELAIAEAKAAEKAKAEALAKAQAEEEAAAAQAKAKAEAEAEATSTATAEEDTSDDDALLASLAGAFDDEDQAEDGRFDDEPETAPLSSSDMEGDDTLMASLAAAMVDPAAPRIAVELSDDAAEALEDEAAAQDLAALDGAGPDDYAAPSDDSDDAAGSDADKPLSFGDDFAKEADALDHPAMATPLPTTPPMPAPTPEAEAEAEASTEASIAPEAPIPDTEDDLSGAEEELSGTEEELSGAEEELSGTEKKLKRARARVIKIRRSAIAVPTASAPKTDDAAALSPEAEADLMRELGETRNETRNDSAAKGPAPANPDADTDAALAAALSDGSEAEGDSAAFVKPVRPQRPDRRITPKRRAAPRTADDEEDASVKRLMDQTDTEFQGTENRRRLSAIAHLKAAVAATVADRKVGGNTGPSEETRMNPYRNDLERAVRPRSAIETPAIKGERPAPLMLVSEQRIDTPRVKPSPSQTHITPVRPRRIPAGNLALTEDDQDDHDLEAASDGTDAKNIFGASVSFAEYAERLGAESLSELLEAAAAYASHIEGQADVSRPKMVEHVMSVQPDLLEDREVMLRSFGTLLREGRLEKVRRGFFALSETSPIQTEARRAAEG